MMASPDTGPMSQRKITLPGDVEQIQISSLLVSLMSLGVFVACDFNPSLAHPWLPVAVLALCWSAPLAQLAGTRKHPGFAFWMPFNGGFRFVLYQAFGWMLFGVAVTLSLLALAHVQWADTVSLSGAAENNSTPTKSACKQLLEDGHSSETDARGCVAYRDHDILTLAVLSGFQSGILPLGLLSAIGSFGFFAQMLLNLSISRFNHVNVHNDDKQTVSGALVPPGRAGTKSHSNDKSDLPATFANGETGLYDLIKTVPIIYWNGRTACALIVSWGGLVLFLACDWMEATPPTSSVLIAIGTGVNVFAAAYTHVVAGVWHVPGFAAWQPFKGGHSFVLLQGFGWLFMGLLLDVSISIVFNTLPVVRWGKTVLGCLGLCGVTLLNVSLPRFISTASSDTPRPTTTMTTTMTTVAAMPWSGECYVSLALLVMSPVSLTALRHVNVGTGWGFVSEGTQSWLCIMAMLLAGPIAQFGGRRMWAQHGFSLWQPFTGGATFVFAQAFGWMLYGVALLFAILYYVTGVDFGLSSTSLFAQCLILVSVNYFEPQANMSSIPNDISGDDNLRNDDGANGRRGNSRWDVEALVALALCIAACALMVVLDIAMWRRTLQADNQLILLITSTTGYAVSALLIHVVAGPRRHASWSLWQPFVGGSRFVVLQMAGWTMFSIMQFASLIVSFNAMDSIPVGLPSTIGFLSLSAQWALLLSLGEFEQPVLRQHSALHLEATVTGWETARVDSGLLEQDTCELRQFAKSATSPVVRRLLESAADELEHKLTLTTQQSNLPSGSRGQPGPGLSKMGQPVAAFVATGAAGFCAAADVFHGTSAVSLLFMLGISGGVIAAIATHWSIAPRLHSDWRFYQPFRGGSLFVLMQGVAWTLFGISLLLAGLIILWFGTHTIASKFIGLHAATGVLQYTSVLIMLLSLKQYEPSHTNSEGRKRGVSHPSSPSIDAIPNDALNDASANWFTSLLTWSVQWCDENRDQVAPLLLSLGSVSIFLFADVVLLRFGDGFPIQPAAGCATLAISVSIPLTFWLGGTRLSHDGDNGVNNDQRVARGFHPLLVTPGYAVLEILGWALWSFTILLGALVAFNYGGTTLTRPLRRRSDWVMATAGACGAIAQVLVLVSMQCTRASSHQTAAVGLNAASSTGDHKTNAAALSHAVAATRSAMTRQKFLHKAVNARAPETTLLTLPTDVLTHILSCLPAPIVVRLGVTCKTMHFLFEHESFWHGYFVARWGSDLRVTHSTRVARALPSAIARPTRRLLSAIEAALMLPQRISSRAMTHASSTVMMDDGDCDPSSNSTSNNVTPTVSADNTPRRRGSDESAHGPAAFTPIRKIRPWVLACLFKDGVSLAPHMNVTLRRCALCNCLDVDADRFLNLERQRLQLSHQTSVWVQPCDCEHITMHRRCLERRLDALEGRHCETCGAVYKTAYRLPLTMAELVKATMSGAHHQQWRSFALSALANTLAILGVISLLEAVYVDWSDLSTWELQRPQSVGGCATLIAVTLSFLIQMFRSRRFVAARGRLYARRHTNPLYRFYTHVCLYFVFAIVTLFIQYVRIPLWSAGWNHMWRSSLPWGIVSHGNLIVFLASSWSILILFWSTSVRLATAAAQNSGSAVSHGADCFCCGLEICLDSH